MQQTSPITPTKLKGIDILSFESAELNKVEDQTSSFIQSGTLSVLYFREFDRFTLYLNGWEYVLAKRLTVTSSSKIDLLSRYYTLPGQDCYYILKLSKIPHITALQNFETILADSTNFIYQEEGEPLEADKIVLDNISQTNQAIEEEEGGFIKKGFAKVANRILKTFSKNPKDNINLTHARDIVSLKNTSEESTTVHVVSKEEIEEAFMLSEGLDNVKISNISEAGNSGTPAKDKAKRAGKTEVEPRTGIFKDIAELESGMKIEKERQIQADLSTSG